MLELALIIGLAVISSAFCSMSESVLFSLPWTKIEQMRKSGRKSGNILFALRSDVEKPLTAVLTLNTVANTAGASLAGTAWAKLYGEDGALWFAGGFTVLILVVSEILPKTIGVIYNQELAPALARPLHFMVRFFSPVIWACSFLARAVGGKKKGPETTEDDIRALATLSRRAGVIAPYEEASIRNILSLDTKTVQDIMTPRTVVFSMEARTTLGEAWAGRPAWPHSRFPVYDEDPEDVVGIVYRSQIFEALAKDQHSLHLSDLMHPVRFTLETTTLDTLLRQFLDSRQHLSVVLDEYGGLAGVVTLEDVLEEILGREIVDETDQVADMRELARTRKKALTARQDAAPPRKGD
jgi:CBS domain containing-hemolysin-like protein